MPERKDWMQSSSMTTPRSSRIQIISSRNCRSKSVAYLPTAESSKGSAPRSDWVNETDIVLRIKWSFPAITTGMIPIMLIRIALFDLKGNICSIDHARSGPLGHNPLSIDSLTRMAPHCTPCTTMFERIALSLLNLFWECFKCTIPFSPWFPLFWVQNEDHVHPMTACFVFRHF